MSPRPSLDLRQPIQSLTTFLTHPAYFWHVAALLLLGDAVLTQLIIRFVPYTEIDFSTYVEQVAIYDKGERDYVLLTGSTGPVVYPAGHVYIHSFLSQISHAGQDQFLLQQIYGALYLLTQFLAMAVYRTAGGVPNWVLLLLAASKRLHSIYVLRLFNDCWNVLGMMGSILAFARGHYTVGSALFSLALLVKMNALLYLPAILLLLYQSLGVVGTLLQLCTLILPIQLLPALPFLLFSPYSYLTSAFDLGRIFLYKWTVNWRFVPEATFLSSQFARLLMTAHLGMLGVFLIEKWSKKDGGVMGLVERGLRRPFKPAQLVRPSSDYIVTLLFTTNLIGIVYARSLHYQFYSWYALQIPFLLWRTPFPVPLKLSIWAGIEYAWNVYPSTVPSSIILVAGNALILLGVFFGTSNGKEQMQPRIARDSAPAGADTKVD
ncbi:glycosyltransferase family 58 protein [Dacryopinax primogenitus]|uniref:Dol-P-Man:Man(5)GlcNAc(2)-PP-Dol alpha-1,3-mannosyltransferase n=1 Tax=Dacryopinax primogenitus (strain DJM 731) TaxID=1858805 RepID=M5FRN8_DACPD|nr:glycosyltransferase family 58 protein [Dacryopinax primogenitus]EJT98393.1 glycosyltransferase family 58 protein [Dacryopinax primogenitus]